MLKLVMVSAAIAAIACAPARAAEMGDGSIYSAMHLGVGEISFFSTMTTPGIGEVHPIIRLRDGSSCDLLNLVCLSRAERDCGIDAYFKLHRAVRQIAGQSL
jgi:hypothetical protein